MTETKVNQIIGMIKDNADSNRIMCIKDDDARMGFYTWVRMDLVRETLREVEDDESGS